MTHDQKIIDAIESGESLSLTYQGNPRKVIPLAYGLLKNGKEALLCYKINAIYDDGPDLSIRLYHIHKVDNVEPGKEHYPFSRKIDYYLTKLSKVFTPKSETK